MIIHAILWTSELYHDFIVVEGLWQTVLFIVVACMPAWKTGRISYVDVAWPWGLALIGVLVLLFADGWFYRRIFIGIIYMMIGARMGMGAIVLWSMGRLNKEFPRYEYRHLIWKKANVTNVRLEVQIEIIKQLVANISCMLIPALALGFDKTEGPYVLEVIGLLICGGAWTFESIADV